MEKKHLSLILVAALVLCGFTILALMPSAVGDLLFDQVTYNYTSHVWIPPEDSNGSSLGGTYWIAGKGRNFKLFLILPGAEKGESPLDYTSDGMNGTGHIENIQVTPQTIQSLLNRDFKTALFNTRFQGNMDVSCAAWTGKIHFENKITEFPGNFTIDGPMTDWEGGFQIFQQNNRIVIKGDYILYPTGQKNSSNIQHVIKEYYF
ncbi:MAG TPA: hypothetical protein VK444_05375 [Methanobacteriaceae archaeon]|nr:hypothetical protein [Methanobacteriaceae archaeon]